MTRRFDPAFADRVVALAADGLSRAETAVALGVSLADFDAWAKDNQVFAAALADADTLARAWWDRQPREAMASGKSFRVALWAKVMAQRYGRPGHTPRAPDTGKPPPVRARYELPDNGTSRRRTGEGGRARQGKNA
jgi:hypothetical protein